MSSQSGAMAPQQPPLPNPASFITARSVPGYEPTLCSPEPSGKRNTPPGFMGMSGFRSSSRRRPWSRAVLKRSDGAAAEEQRALPRSSGDFPQKGLLIPPDQRQSAWATEGPSSQGMEAALPRHSGSSPSAPPPPAGWCYFGPFGAGLSSQGGTRRARAGGSRSVFQYVTPIRTRQAY